MLNGLLLIDKPVGLTSHDVVHHVRKVVGQRSVGHAGTLDPQATGLLILMLGEATKLSDFLLTGEKVYEGKMKLGICTDTMDTQGQILETRAVHVTAEEVQRAARGLSGDIELEVPVFSAVKVDGKKLYEFARQGERPENLPRRVMGFYDIRVIDQGGDWVSIGMRCSKGSFVRAWANELGVRLGCGAIVEVLRRTRSEPFSVESALTLEELKERWQAAENPRAEILGGAWVPLREALPQYKMLTVGGQDAILLRNGQIPKSLVAELIRSARADVLDPVRVSHRDTGDMLALLVAEKGEFYKIRRVFHPG